MDCKLSQIFLMTERRRKMSLKLMYITNIPEVALIAEKNGVERIMVDLETLGKEERQKNMNTVKSHHTVEDVRSVSCVLTSSEMLVRINPWNECSKKEIEDVISAGADRWTGGCRSSADLPTVAGLGCRADQNGAGTPVLRY